MSRKIKSEKIYRVTVIPGKEEEIDLSDGTLQSHHRYDGLGNLLLEENFSDDGSVTEKNEFTFDEQGRILGSVIYGEDDMPLEIRKLRRDEAGMIVAEEVSYMDGSADIIEYSYRNGQLAEKTRRTEDDEIESKEKYEYEGDLLIRFERTDYDNQLVYQVINSYKDGILSESSISNFESEQPYRQVIRYNEAGRRMEELRYDKRDRLIERNSFEEDENGRVVMMVEENTARKNTTEMAYDDNGRLVRQSETDINGQVLSDIERSYSEDGIPEATRVLLLDRMTGLHQQYLLVYEYEFYEDL